MDSHEELHDLDPLPFPELVMRLVLLYKHLQENPATDEIPKEEIIGTVTPDNVEVLCKYLYFADQAYDCGTEGNLKEVLDEHGRDPLLSHPCPFQVALTELSGSNIKLNLRPGTRCKSSYSSELCMEAVPFSSTL